MRMRYLSLAGFLFVFWLALSGHFTPMLVVAGVVCTILCVLAAIRMRAADAEGHPVEVFRGVLTYYPWLIPEIAKSAWTVTKIILSPKLPISAYHRHAQARLEQHRSGRLFQAPPGCSGRHRYRRQLRCRGRASVR